MRILQLEKELAQSREDMRSITEDQEAANEELQSANEELLSGSEELQSLNEELETGKEELQSTNEELTVVNNELISLNEQLTLERNFSDAIIDTLHEPLIVLDNQMRIKTCNKAFYKTFLVNEAETEGKLIFELGNGQWNAPGLRTMLEKVLPEKLKFTEFQVVHYFQKIGERVMLLNGQEIIKQNSSERLILLAIEDITESQQAKKNLEEKNIELERMNSELESFSYVASHDLQEPLRKIQTFAMRILEKEHENLSDTGKEYFRRMQNAAKRMKVLIEDLLSFSRVNNTEKNFETIDLHKIVEDVKKDFQEEIEQKMATIELFKTCTIKAIPFQFRQLIQNLIANSLKFQHPGKNPHITLSSSFVNSDTLRNEKLLPGTNYCHIIISDNGIGFEPEFNEKIFEVFQRLHRKEEYAGTGIGLAIVKKIVENHKGYITAKGELNEGATFDIFIPVL